MVVFLNKNRNHPKKPNTDGEVWFVMWRGLLCALLNHRPILDIWRKQFDDEGTNSFLQQKGELWVLENETYK